MPLYVWELMLQGVLGGIDVILNHELLARLPRRADTGEEELLHSGREFVFAALFLSLAWYEWQGMLAWWIVALFLAERWRASIMAGPAGCSAAWRRWRWDGACGMG